MVSEKDLYWAMGFIEGEGSFSITTVEKNTKMSKALQVGCVLQVSNVERDRGGVEFIRNIFSGTITFKSKDAWVKRGLVNAQNQVCWKMQSINDCINFCDLVKEYKWKTTKGNNFLIWKKAVDLIHSQKHLEKEGLIELLKLREELIGYPRNKNVRSINYFLPIIDAMDSRGLFSAHNVLVRGGMGDVNRQKQKEKWDLINKEGYVFGVDSRKKIIEPIEVV